MALLLALMVACGGPEPESDARSNLLLVVIDTLGSEHVGHLGLDIPGAAASVAPPEPSPTPHLDALAARGVAFRRAYSPAPWTQPAVASLFTARMPSEHGLVRLFGRLGGDLPTLGEHFRDAGWATAGVISHSLLEARFGLDRGFGTWDDSPVGGHGAVTSDRVTAAALSWLDGDRPRNRPFVLLVHYFDPHYVYNHHPEHDRTAGYEGPLRSGMEIWKLRDLRPGLTAADVGYVSGLYREEIDYTDAALGRLLAGLAARDLLDETWVAVTADHGEELMRHGWIGHTRTLYDELLRVPLVIAPPAGRSEKAGSEGSGGGVGTGAGARAAAGAVIDEPVSLLDLAPTLVDLLGAGEWAAPAQASAATFQPVSLAPLIRPRTAGSKLRRRLAERDLFAEVSFAEPEGGAGPTGRPRPPSRAEKEAFQTAIVAGPLKLIHDLAAGTWHLYDLTGDPEELNDLAGTGHPAERGLRRRLLEWERSRGTAGGGDDADLLVPSDEERERLRALGYLR